MFIENIYVIDAPCGIGKTSWAIQDINENDEQSYVYCTPYLSEIDRIRESCGHYTRFAEPRPYYGPKINDFNTLLAEGVDIAVTHTTFLNATDETLDLIRLSSYTLIIDEALDVITDFNKVQTVESDSKQTVSFSDIQFLLEHKIIEIGEDNRVSWRGGNNGEDFKFSEVQRFANLGRLYCISNKLFLTVFPPEMFKCFKNVYILTYMFDGCILKSYLDLFDLTYRLLSVNKDDTGRYLLTDYDISIDIDFRKKCKELIHICDDERLNTINGKPLYSLSKKWYENSDIERLKSLRNNLTYYFRRYLKDVRASNGDIMWTCYNDYKDKLKGPGYTKVRKMTADEKQLPTQAQEELEKQLSCFVPCNAKASNIYRERSALAYCVNMFLNPMVLRFFTDGNDIRKSKGLPEISFNEDAYALSCLLQWMFRSCIRDGYPIDFYIPSQRMRNLLIGWINCEDITSCK